MILVDSLKDLEEVQGEIKARLEDNTVYFSQHSATLIKAHPTITSSLTDLSTIVELENERMEISLKRAQGFSGEFDRVAGDIIKLAKERKELTQAITKIRQLQMISNHFPLF